MTEAERHIDIMMAELFKFRRLGQEPRDAMESVVEHLIRPENRTFADGLKTHCIDAPPPATGEDRRFFGFVLQSVSLIHGRSGDREELQRLAPFVHESYARHRAALEGAGLPPLTPELKRVDALLKEQHRWLHVLGDVEKHAYRGAIVAFPILWLGLKWRW